MEKRLFQKCSLDRTKKHATVRGFKLSTLYATINVTWKDIVNDWYKAKRGGPELLKTFLNTVLAEPWEEKGEQLDEDVLFNRREMYHADVPDGVKVLTAAVDTQDNRFEVEIQGWGAGHENWRRLSYYALLGLRLLLTGRKFLLQQRQCPAWLEERELLYFLPVMSG
jgi:phage terminase large subunit GpA-like protein